LLEKTEVALLRGKLREPFFWPKRW